MHREQHSRSGNLSLAGHRSFGLPTHFQAPEPHVVLGIRGRKRRWLLAVTAGAWLVEGLAQSRHDCRREAVVPDQGKPTIALLKLRMAANR